MAARPDVMTDFNSFMESDRGSRPDWVDWFPVQQQLLDGFKADEEAVLLVDVAGGRGHDIALFKNKFPQAPGRLVLQDLPRVIDDVENLHEGIERCSHDFFTPQPIKGQSTKPNPTPFLIQYSLTTRQAHEHTT